MTTVHVPATPMFDELAEEASGRIRTAIKMFHNAHEYWGSEEAERGLTYLEWIDEAINRMADEANEREKAYQRLVEFMRRVAKGADEFDSLSERGARGQKAVALLRELGELE